MTLPDGNKFTVGVTHWGGYPAPLCDVANQVIVSALAVINRGQIPRRPRPFPADSIALVDACSLLDSSDVTTAFGEDTPGEATFGDWECGWSFGPKEVHIAFDRENWPLELDDRRQITVGTRNGFVQEGTSGWPNACQVEIEYRQFDADEQLVETVEIYVEQTDTEPAENCAEAQVLAQAVNDRLPRAD